MDKTEQKKPDQAAPVVSPLATEKTYGERVFTRIFDNFLNYWTNLLSSAGFSQWAEHATRPLPGLKSGASPRDIQAKFAEWLSETDPLLKRLYRVKKEQLGEDIAKNVLAERSMARSRSLTLLIPGFAVMIPSVWLGAKIKPWMVEKLNAWHYGQEALDDPTLHARHQAIEAEAKPTLLGTFIARLGTMVAVQIAAQGIGSRHNLLNEIGGKRSRVLKEFAIDPMTEHAGESIGGAIPADLRNRYNNFAKSHGLDWSNKQIEKTVTNFASRYGIGTETNPVKYTKLTEAANKIMQNRASEKSEANVQQILREFVGAHGVQVPGTIKISGDLKKKTLGAYDNATQDLGRFIAADTFYTLISAGTIRPFLKLLKYVPFMSYKSKNAPEAPTIDGEPIKVPSHPMATASADTSPEKMTADAIAKAKESSKAAAKPEPKPSISTITNEGTLNERLMEAAV